MRSDADSRLVAAARGGDRAAFAALVARHHDALMGICARALADRELGADAAQEAVLLAMLGLDRLRDDDRFGSWLLGIGLNVCRRMARERAARPTTDADPPADGADPAERAEAVELAGRVHAAIAGLPRGQRDAVALYYFAGLSQAEIAEQLGTAAGAVKTRLHKARAALRPQLIDLREERQDMDTAVQMQISDVRRTAQAAHHVVVLEDASREHRLAIWVGRSEASALAELLDGVELPRPRASAFAHALLSATGTGVREVRVSRLLDQIFYAQVVLTNGATVDARPTDALGLALVTDAPIAVERAVLEAARRSEAALPEYVAEAAGAPDGARALADEARAELATDAEERAAIAARLGAQ